MSETKEMDELTENEITLVCYAAFHDEEEANEILKGTGLSLRNKIIYRNGKEIGTTHTEYGSCSMEEFTETHEKVKFETND